ncbi:MAG: hypothetical protein ABIH72_06005 [archaeon]
MKFDQVKRVKLGKKDRSNINSWDTSILNLCNKINNKKDYYTTSSCSGRILLLKESDKKQKGLFLFRTHDKISFNKLKKELNKIDYKGLIYFKQEPCLVVACCENMNSAKKLLENAKLSGFKISGIMSSGKRIVCEMFSTEKIILPIMNKRKILVDDAYLKLLVKEANKKLWKTREKIKKFENLL